MASVKSGYGRGAVYGSLAYDFNHPELYGDEAYSLPQEERPPAERAGTQEQVRTRARRAVHTRQGISPFAILGILAAAFLFVIAITAQVRLMSVSGESVALQSKLAELQEDQAKLRIAYESAFNLAEIEEYATTALGMQKPGADQVTYIDTSAPDKAVVIGGGARDGLVDRVADFLSALGAYFQPSAA